MARLVIILFQGTQNGILSYTEWSFAYVPKTWLPHAILMPLLPQWACHQSGHRSSSRSSQLDKTDDCFSLSGVGIAPASTGKARL